MTNVGSNLSRLVCQSDGFQAGITVLPFRAAPSPMMIKVSKLLLSLGYLRITVLVILLLSWSCLARLDLTCRVQPEICFRVNERLVTPLSTPARFAGCLLLIQFRSTKVLTPGDCLFHKTGKVGPKGRKLLPKRMPVYRPVPRR